MTDAIEKPLQSLTPELVKSKLQIVLTKTEQSIQALHDKKKELVFNEDNLEVIKSYLDGCRKIVKTVEEERTKMKEPYLQGGRTVDAGAKLISAEVEGLIADVDKQYQKICKEVAEEARKAETEKQRKANILSEIDNFFIAQSQAIANATDPQELVRIEKLIGSHKSAARYGEFLPLMAQKAQILAELIRTAKDAIKKIAELRAKESLAEASGDDQAILDSREAQEQLLAKISEIGEVVQTEAINMAVNSGVVEPEILTPSAPKPRRVSYKYQIIDEKLAAKAGLMKLVPDEEKIDAILAGKRKDGIECTENGIRYYKHFDY